MAMQRADIMGTRHELNITYPTPQETLAGSPTLLPTSEPASATFSYTVAASDFPVFDGVPLSVEYVYFVYAGGVNTDASNARTLCYRIKKNGTSVATATNLSVTANQKWTLNMHHLTISIGDVIEVFLWQVTTNALNWSFQGLGIVPTRIQVCPINQLIAELNYTPNDVYPSFTSGTPSVSNSNSPVTYYKNYGQPLVILNGNNSNTTAQKVYGFKQDATYKLYRFDYGDYTTGNNVTNSATDMPRVRSGSKIIKIEWTPTALVV